jgi:catechol 2,3-dioxygenase-like lactoylglutathione lyase family enzyme
MKQRIGSVSLLVRDYDEAIEYFSKMLDFRVVEDTAIESEGKRWVLVAPPGSTECSILLAKPRREEDAAMIGSQAGKRVFLFLHTDDFWRDYRRYRERGVHFCEEPRTEAYGTVVVFEDLYGNRWDLLQQNAPNKAPEPTPGAVTPRATEGASK